MFDTDLQMGTVQNLTGGLSEGFARQGISQMYQNLAHDDAVKAKKQKIIDDSIASNKELLAQPDKLDRLVANNLSDLYPYAKKPSTKDQEIKTDAIDESMKSHPLHGTATLIKNRFQQALADPRLAGLSHPELLDAVKKDAMTEKLADGMTRQEKALDFKYKKDFGFWSHAEDKNVLAPQGYEEYKKKQEMLHPNNTSALEAIATNAGFTAALGIGAAAVAGGVPAVVAGAGAIAMRTLAAAAVAVPEFKLMDAVANAVATTDATTGDTNWGTQAIVGLASLALMHKVVGVGTTKALTKAMETGKFAESAANIAQFTGKAPDALKAYRAAGEAEIAIRAAEAAQAEVKAAALKTQAEEFMSKIDEAVPGIPEDKVLARELSLNRAIAPDAAHAMGLSAEEFRAAQGKPSILYSALSDEGVTAVHEAVSSGVPADVASIMQFNKEAALAKAKKLADYEGGNTKFMQDANTAYGIKPFNELMLDPASKVTKKRGKKGSSAILGALGIGTAAVGVLGDAEDSEAGTIDAAIKASGSVFNSAAATALEHAKFPETVHVQGESLWNQFKKFGVTKAEFTDLGFNNLEQGTKLSKSELAKLVEERGIRLDEKVLREKPSELKQLVQLSKEHNNFSFATPGDAVGNIRAGMAMPEALPWKAELEAEGMRLSKEVRDSAQYKSFSSIKDSTGVIPGSYREEFITYPNAKTSWVDHNVGYSDVVNPVGGFRSDIQQLPDGRKVMRLHEVQKRFQADSDIPQTLADNWSDLTLKKAIAVAKAEGVDGIAFATGEQQKAIYKKLPADATWPKTLYGDFNQATGAYDHGIVGNKLKKYTGGEHGLLDSLNPADMQQQPVVWLSKDTPTAFKLYSHPATIFGVGLTAGALAFQAQGAPTGTVLSQNVLDNANEKGVLRQLADFISPSSAYAGTLQTAKLAVNAAVGESLLSKTDKALTEIITELKAKNLISAPVAPGQVTFNEPMRQLKTAPIDGRSAQAAAKTVRTFSAPVDAIASSMTPDGMQRVYAQTEHKITVQMASMQSAIANNTDKNLQVINNILTPVLKGENAGSEIAKFMKPIQDKYNGVVLPLRTIEIETEKSNKLIANLKETLGAGDGAGDKHVLDKIKFEQDKIAKLTEEYSQYAPQLDGVTKAYDDAIDSMMSKYKTTRISMALENPKLMSEGKYAALYSSDEKAAVQQLTDCMEGYKARAKEFNMSVIDGPFNHHSMDKVNLNEAFAEKLKLFGISDPKSISMSSFLERSKYSKQMIPDIERNMLEYIPDAERRINIAELWDVKNPNGWHAFSQNELITTNKVWNDFFTRLKSAYNPKAGGAMSDAVNRYTQFETLRLLFAAPSAAFKHLFKNEGTWATLGFVNSMHHMPESLEVVSRNAVNAALERIGSANLMPRGLKDQLAASLTKQRSMLSVLDGVEKDPGVVEGFDKWIGKLNNVGGVGIQAVEAFDRTHTVLSAMAMAQKKGMTAEQSMYSIYDTILKNNFLGGGLNPAWMNSPTARALMLFQGTPFKIMERRLTNALALGADVKSAFGVIKSRDVATNLEELREIGAYIFKAQTEIKSNMIYDALTAHKDSFGNSVAAQFVREAIITGGVIAGGHAVGMDFNKHSLHIPFIKESASPELAVNPLVTAGWKTAFGKDDKDFFISRFVQNYTKQTGGLQPLMFHKISRLTHDDIPEQYRGSKFKYLFSVPSTKD